MVKKYLYPCEIFISTEPTEITTVLGSCISVCLFDPVCLTGGINHFMLPEIKDNKNNRWKYGDAAINELIRRMIEKGAKIKNLKAKIFGGYSYNGKDNQFNIGSKNTQMALDILSDRKINIAGQSTGGETARKIVFYSHTGEVYLKYIEALNI